MWGFAIVRLLAALVLGALVGQFFEDWWIGVAITLSAFVAWQLLNLFRLDYWLRHRSIAKPPALGGIWDDIVTQVVRLYRRKRYHKQAFLQLMREVRNSTGAMPDGVVVLNKLGEIAWMNRMAAELLDLRRKQDIGLRVENLVRQPEFARYLAGTEYGAPTVIRASGTTDHYLSCHVLPYGDGQRLLLVRDVTRQTRLEAMRKDFVANASHELRSPLTVISGYLETLSGDPALDRELVAPVEEMRRQTGRMTAIIRDLLELSRLETTEYEVSGAPIDVPAMLAMLRKDVLARANRPADVRLEVDSDQWLLGDEPEIHSAFSNLVDNAAKYTPASGRMAIHWRADEDGGHFAVSDTGMGIPQEHIPRLTERFYRVDPGRSRATGGSGLGLAIVKHVLQRHGATLTIDSAEGSGSTFACHFPPRRLLPPQSRAMAEAG